MNTLPPTIVAALDALGSELVNWAEDHRDSTLADQEPAEMARVLPAGMLFVPSKRGLSHTKEEDTDEADLVAGIEAFSELARRVMRGFPG